MIKDHMTSKERIYEKVYRAYADDIYKLSLYYLEDEENAENLTVQVFLNYYKYYDETNSDYILGCLINEAKKILLSGQNEGLAVEEVGECTMSGKS